MERQENLPLAYRLEQNERIEQERKEWHRRKREESDDWSDAYDFLEAQEKSIVDQMAQMFHGVAEGCRQIAQVIEPEPLRQKYEPTISKPLQQKPDIFGTITSPLSIGALAMMFLDPEAMRKALRRMELCKEIFDADQQFLQRMYPISGWEI